MSLIKLASPVPVLAAGVSVVAGGSVYSNSQSSSAESKNPRKEEEVSRDLKVEEVKEETGCIIYTVVRLFDEQRHYRVGEILEKKGRNIFLQGIDSTHAGFINDINDACGNRNNKRGFRAGGTTQVYVYKENGRWTYTSSLQSSDWTKDTRVIGRAR